MSVTLMTLDAMSALATLQALVQEAEDKGFELIALAKGLIDGLPANIVTLHPSAAPQSPVTLGVISGALTELQQQTQLTEHENQGKMLLSYGVVFVNGQETNVAVCRG